MLILLSFFVVVIVISVDVDVDVGCCGVSPPRCIVSQIAGAVLFGAVSKGEVEVCVLMSIGYDDLYKTFEDVLVVHTFKLS